MEFKLNDILTKEDLEMYKLEFKDYYANCVIYADKDHGVLLQPIKHKEDILYKVKLSYKK